MSKTHVFQFLVQFPDNIYSDEKLEKIKEPVLKTLHSLRFPAHLHTCTYTFCNVDFVVFNFASEQEISPIKLAQLASLIKAKYNCLFCFTSINFDLGNQSGFKKKYELGELRD